MTVVLVGSLVLAIVPTGSRTTTAAKDLLAGGSPAVPVWANVTGWSGASPRQDLWASMAYDPIDAAMVLFAGCTVAVCPYPSSTWMFRAGAWTNVTSIGPQPPPRSYAQMAFDGSDGYVVLFGGAGASALSDTWSFLGGHWTNRTSTVGSAPPGRWAAGFAYDAKDGYDLLFGGISGSGVFLNDSWGFSGGRWTNLTAGAGTSPPARFETSLAWDDADQEAILVDGCGVVACPINDTWGFASGQWHDLTSAVSPLPPARFLEALTYDVGSRSLRLFGGVGETRSLGDTWAFQGSHWSVLDPQGSASPRPREGAAFPEDTGAWVGGVRHDSAYALLYGGDWISCASCGLQGLNDTWAYEVPPNVSVARTPAAAITGEDESFNATVSGGSSPYNITWSFGDGTSAFGPSVHHRFATAGSFIMNCSVKDDVGLRSSITSVVEVTAPRHGAVEPWPIVVAGAAGAGAIVLAIFFRRRRKIRAAPQDSGSAGVPSDSSPPTEMRPPPAVDRIRGSGPSAPGQFSATAARASSGRLGGVEWRRVASRERPSPGGLSTQMPLGDSSGLVAHAGRPIQFPG